MKQISLDFSYRNDFGVRHAFEGRYLHMELGLQDRDRMLSDWLVHRTDSLLFPEFQKTLETAIDFKK